MVLWMENASAISNQNSGSGAMKLTKYYDGKRGIKGWAQDAYPGFKRYAIATIMDHYHQVVHFLHRIV